MAARFAFAATLTLLLAAASAPLFAGESSLEEDSWAYGRLQGPLTLSGDGRWRVHVDGRHILHRVNLHDATLSGALPLPVGVQAIAASRTARKVALLTDSGCIALADFGSDAQASARVTWRPLPVLPTRAFDPAPGRRGQAALPWLAEPPTACTTQQDFYGSAVIALSGDGRLLATESEVVDLEAHRVVATRARTGRERPILARFVDGDKRLLTVDALLGEEVGPGNVPSHFEVATWDLKTGTLLTLSDRQGLLDTPTAQLAVLADATATVYGADAPLQWDQSHAPVPAKSTAWRADGCAPASVRPLAIDGWRNMAVDPWGRWIAGTRRLAQEPSSPETRAGFTDELVVLELASGRQLARSPWKHALAGLSAGSDGTHLYALSVASTAPGGLATAPADPAVRLGEVVDIALPAQAVSARAEHAAAWPTQPCLLDHETAQARAVAHVDRMLPPAWTLPLAEAQASERTCEGTCAMPFLRRDGTIWLDIGATITELDGATGRPLRSLPTPRSAKVLSVPVGASDGFFNAQGDTVTWRPFDAAEPGAAAKRIVDRRPGWMVTLLERQGNAALAAWVRKDAPSMDDPGGGAPREHAYAFYDPAGRKVSERTGSEDWGGDGWPTSDELQHDLIVANEQPCHDETGALANGFDWRIGPFNSIVAWSCGPEAGVAHIALWSDIDVRPRSESRMEASGIRRIAAQDGAIGIVEETGRYRVFDAARNLELAQIALPPGTEPVGVTVSARLGLILFQTAWDSDAPATNRVRAYSFR